MDYNSFRFPTYDYFYSIVNSRSINLTKKQKEIFAKAMTYINLEFNILSDGNVFDNFYEKIVQIENKIIGKGQAITSIDSNHKKIYIGIDDSQFINEKGKFQEDLYCRAVIHELLHAASARFLYDNEYNGLANKDNIMIDEITTVYLESMIFEKYFTEYSFEEEIKRIKLDKDSEVFVKNNLLGYGLVSEYAKGIDLLENFKLKNIYFLNDIIFDYNLDQFAQEYKALNSSLSLASRPNINKKDLILQTNYIFFDLIKDKIHFMHPYEYLDFSQKLKDTMSLKYKEKGLVVDIIDESIKSMDIYYFYEVLRNKDEFKNLFSKNVLGIDSNSDSFQRIYSNLDNPEINIFLKRLNNFRSRFDKDNIDYYEIKKLLKGLPYINETSFSKKSFEEVCNNELLTQYLVFSKGISENEIKLKNNLEMASLTIDSYNRNFKKIFELIEKNERDFSNKIRKVIKLGNPEPYFFIDIINNVNDKDVFNVLMDKIVEIAKSKNDLEWLRTILNDKITLNGTITNPIEYCANQSKYEIFNIIFEKTWKDIYFDTIKVSNINNFLEAKYYYNETNANWLKILNLRDYKEEDLLQVPLTIINKAPDMETLKKDFEFFIDSGISYIFKEENASNILNSLIFKKYTNEEIIDLYKTFPSIEKEPIDTFKNIVSIYLEKYPEDLLEIEKRLGKENVDYDDVYINFLYDNNLKGIEILFSSENLNLLDIENFYDGIKVLIENNRNETLINYFNKIDNNDFVNSFSFVNFVVEKSLKSNNFEIIDYVINIKGVSFEMIQDVLTQECSRNCNKNMLQSIEEIFKKDEYFTFIRNHLMCLSMAFGENDYAKDIFKNNSFIEIFGEDKDIALINIEKMKSVLNDSFTSNVLKVQMNEAQTFFENIDKSFNF